MMQKDKIGFLAAREKSGASARGRDRDKIRDDFGLSCSRRQARRPYCLSRSGHGTTHGELASY